MNTPRDLNLNHIDWSLPSLSNRISWTGHTRRFWFFTCSRLQSLECPHNKHQGKSFFIPIATHLVQYYIKSFMPIPWLDFGTFPSLGTRRYKNSCRKISRDLQHHIHKLMTESISRLGTCWILLPGSGHNYFSSWRYYKSKRPVAQWYDELPYVHQSYLG